jgi:hypothetical protein
MKKIMFNDRYGLTQAVIEGRKTVTRRIMNRQPDPDDIAYMEPKDYPCQPPYKVGEIVAVAQCYADIHSELMIGDFGDARYDSFKNAVVHDKAGWHNKMFVQADLMPHQIRITSVRPERLQDITDEDCMKEGIQVLDGRYYYRDSEGRIVDDFDNPRAAFASLINKISGRGTWERNPFVWVYEFKLVK